MKIKPHEISALKTAITARGMHSLDFEWIKRKGKLHIISSKKDHPFIFYRKAVSTLNDKGQFTTEMVYTVYGKESSVGELEWENVLSLFEEWLNGLMDE